MITMPVVRISFIPHCPHCRELISDLLFHYRYEPDVYFYFIPYVNAPNYHDVRHDAMNIVPYSGIQVSRNDVSKLVPTVITSTAVVVPRSGFRPNVPVYHHHPTTLEPFVRRIKRRHFYDFSYFDRAYKKAYARFIETAYGIKIEEGED